MASAVNSPFKAIVRPVVTEKTALVGSVNNAVVFEVHPDASKDQIRRAVEKIFNVKVDQIRTVNCPKKAKRGYKSIGKQRTWKKAYVSLAEGSSLDVIEGL